MPTFLRKTSASLVNRTPRSSSVPAEVQDDVEHSSGLGKLSDQRNRALYLSSASTATRFLPVGMMASLFAIAALGLLSCSLVAIAGKATQKSATATSSSWGSLISEASQRFGVPVHWIRAVMQLESTGDKGALSPKGAMGLMQIMPESYAELRFRYHLGADPYEPRNNILAGAAYLHEMHERFGPGGFLAAYNAGPGRYEDYLKRCRPLPEETRNYVAALAPMIGVPGVPHLSTGASTASQLTASGATHDGGEHQKASIKSKLNSEISQFDGRQNARTMTLFAIVQAAFEPTSASAQTIDRTALEPPPARGSNATSTAAESLRIRTSIAPRSSLMPSDDTLFAGRSAHAGK